MADAHPKGASSARLGRIHDRILDTYADIEAGTPASHALKNTFKRARDLGSTERASVRDALYGLVRKKRLIDDRLERAAKRDKSKLELLDPPMRNRLRLLAYLADTGLGAEDLEARDPYAFRRIKGLFERLLAGRLAKVKREPIEELAIRVSLPDWLVERLVDAFGIERATEIGTALAQRAPVTLRVNRLVASRDTAQARIRDEHEVESTPTLLSPDGLILSRAHDIQSWPLFLEGLVEVQDEGSQLIALATGAAPGESILDACAGAGGKTLALAAMMEGRGRLVALDPDKRKMAELEKRARRANVKNIQTVVASLLDLPSNLRGTFDAVLMDAPCTGSGVLRRSPDACWRMSSTDLNEKVSLQKRLLTGATDALAANGRLVYATCSVLREENEGVIEDTLVQNTSLSPEPLAWGETLRQTVSRGHLARIGPGPTSSDPDGFFIALLKTIGSILRSSRRLTGLLPNPALLPEERIEGGTSMELAMELLQRENESLREEVRRLETHRALAYRDYLTGAYNKRYFEERVQQGIARARRWDWPFSVVIVDVDNFKAVNETHGQMVGDEVLVRFAQFLIGNLREIDLVSRLGSDEFSIILPYANELGRETVMKRLRNNLEIANVRRSVNLRASMGAASFPVDGEQAGEIIAAADENMYLEKRRRRAALSVN